MKKYMVFFFVLLFVFFAGCSGEAQDPEGQLRTELDDTNLRADIDSVSLNDNVLSISLYKETYLDGDALKTAAFQDTVKILGAVKKHPEIETVTVDYQADLLDANKKDVRESVFTAEFSTGTTNQVGWENVGILDQEEMIEEKADRLFVHPALS